MHPHPGRARWTSGLLAVVLILPGCSSLSRTEKGAIIGATAGGAIGGVIGNQTGSTARGAIIGAAVGGVVGAVIGRQMDKQAEELAQNIPGATVQRIGEGIAVTFDSGILFAVDQSALQPGGQQNLRDLAASLDEYEGTEVLVVGHTDSTGADDYNQSLSVRRADSARTFLLGAGLEASRVVAVGRGEMEPIASNDTDAGRQENRRVEIAIFASEEMQEQMLRQHGR
jgi:outer membrane protein OmpA-like peptidoglycan-associated protein